MLEDGLRITFRHFWTLFFVAALVTVPLHLAYVFSFHNVIALRELAPQIELFPSARQVHLVGPASIHDARLALWMVDALEVVLLPLAVRAARAIIESDERGELPTVVRSWRNAFRRQETRWRYDLSLVAALAIALAVGALLDAIGRLTAEPFGAKWSYVVLGLAQGGARAAGAAFFLGTAAIASRTPAARGRVKGGSL